MIATENNTDIDDKNKACNFHNFRYAETKRGCSVAGAGNFPVNLIPPHPPGKRQTICPYEKSQQLHISPNIGQNPAVSKIAIASSFQTVNRSVFLRSDAPARRDLELDEK